MKQTINAFRQDNARLKEISSSVRVTWRDNVADAFYRCIVDPLNTEASAMTSSMENLTSTLYNIKEQIDSI